MIVVYNVLILFVAKLKWRDSTSIPWTTVLILSISSFFHCIKFECSVCIWLLIGCLNSRPSIVQWWNIRFENLSEILNEILDFYFESILTCKLGSPSVQNTLHYLRNASFSKYIFEKLNVICSFKITCVVWQINSYLQNFRNFSCWFSAQLKWFWSFQEYDVFQGLEDLEQFSLLWK